MAYGLKYKLDYCDINSNPLRLEILERDYSGIVYMIEGSEEPFILQVNNDKGDKSGYFQSTSADISIFADEHFNIDNLLSNDETQLRVDFYKSNVLAWTGFVVPDFFDEEISSVRVVNLTASDRLGTLKSATLEDLSEMVTIQSLLSQSLAKTGLSLPLNTNVTFIRDRGTTVLSSNILSQRLKDTKGRDVSCYDIIKSICVLTNSFITQKGGQWYLQNKLQHEAKTVNRTFSDIHTSGRRTIQPVGADVSVFQEFGGGKIYPDNYDFKDGLSGWNIIDSFNATTNDKVVERYKDVYDSDWGRVYSEPDFGSETTNPYIVVRDIDGAGVAYLPYMEKSNIPIISNNTKIGNIKAEITASGLNRTIFRVEIIVDTGDKLLYLNDSGDFTTTVKGLTIDLTHKDPEGYIPVTKTFSFDGEIKALDSDDDVNDYILKIRVFGAGRYDQASGVVQYFNTYLLRSVIISYPDASDRGTGLIYKTTQGANYSKAHDTDTTIFGDYLTSGLNGYFYDYPSDDTSSILKSNGTKTSKWTSYGDEEKLPILQHSVRQRARMFSSAHNILNISFETEFNHLDIFGACTAEKYVFVSGEYQFRKRLLSATIEEVKISALDKRDYIYSYFGGSDEKSVSSVGGVSGGTSSGGGGVSTPQYWQLDEDGNLFTEYNAYSMQNISAFGQGKDGEGGDGSGQNVEWGETANNYSPLTVGLTEKTVALSGHKHTMADITDFSGGGGGSTVQMEDAGTTAISLTVDGVTKYISRTNHIHNIFTLEGINSQIGFTDGYVLTWDASTSKLILKEPSGGSGSGSVAWGDITGKPSAFSPSSHTHGASDITSGTFAVARIPNLTVSKITDLSTNYYNKGEVDGLISSVSGGGGSAVTWGATSNNQSPLTVNGVSKTVSLSGHTHSQYLTEHQDISNLATKTELAGKANTSHTHTIVNVTGLQSALNAKQNTLIAGANITISGNTISASGGMSSVTWGDIIDKPSTFAPSSHTHSQYLTEHQDISNLATKTELAGKANTSHTHTIVNVPGLQSALNAKQNTLIAGANITISGNTISASGGMSSVTWGDIIDKPSTFAPSSHTHSQYLTEHQDISNLATKTELAGKANTSHTHTIVNVTGLQSALNAKQNTLIAGANITISGNTISASGGMSSVTWGDIIDKPSTFAPSSHTHSQYLTEHQDISNLATKTELAGKANTSHTHTIVNVTGLQSALNAKAPVNDASLTGTTTVAKLSFGNGWTLEPSGTELVFKYNGVIKQRMLSDGTILATGGITALSTE